MHDDTPINPEPLLRRHPLVEGLIDEVTDYTLSVRVVIGILMMAAAWTFFWSAFVITRFDHWVPWAFAVGLFEPLGVVSLLAALFMVWPNSALGQWFARAVSRARFVLLTLFVVLAGGTAIVVLWLLWEWSDA